MAALLKSADVSVSEGGNTIDYRISDSTLFEMALVPKLSKPIDRDVVYVGKTALTKEKGFNQMVTNKWSTVYSRSGSLLFQLDPDNDDSILVFLSAFVKSNLRTGPGVTDSPVILTERQLSQEAEDTIKSYFPGSSMYTVDNEDEIEPIRVYGTKYPIDMELAKSLLMMQIELNSDKNSLDCAIQNMRKDTLGMPRDISKANRKN